MTKWDVFNAVKRSRLPAPARLVMVMLLDAASESTARIPAEWTPSLTQLAGWTGLSRSTVATQLNDLEALGWVQRDRPSVAAARSKKERTQYALQVGQDPESKDKKASPSAGLVREPDQSASPSVGLVNGSDSRTSPAPGPELVREPDQASPAVGPELVRQPDTIPPPPFTPQSPIARPAAALSAETALFDVPPPPAKPETANQRINRLTKTYTDKLPLSNFMAVQSIVRTAVRAEYSDDQITGGLARLAAEPGRPVTANTLRIAIENGTGAGHQPYRDPDPASYHGDL